MRSVAVGRELVVVLAGLDQKVNQRDCFHRHQHLHSDLEWQLMCLQSDFTVKELELRVLSFHGRFLKLLAH